MNESANSLNIFQNSYFTDILIKFGTISLKKVVISLEKFDFYQCIMKLFIKQFQRSFSL